VKYNIVFSNQAVKDSEKIKKAGLKNKTKMILKIIEKNPYTPPYEKLIGDLKGYYSRRINIQHRIVYQIYEEEKIIKIIRMWTHYE